MSDLSRDLTRPQPLDFVQHMNFSLSNGPVLPAIEELHTLDPPVKFIIFRMNGTTTRLSGKEVAKHNSRESCWIIVHGVVHSL